MKHLELFENYSEKEFKDEVAKFLWEGKYLYHFTLDYHVDNIFKSGLIPRAEPNSYYDDANEGVCLTSNNSFYKTNLPGVFMTILDEHLDSDGNFISEHPFTRLKIDTTYLDYDKFVADDDYPPKMGETREEDVIGSLRGGYGVTYLDEIHMIAEETKDFPW